MANRRTAAPMYRPAVRPGVTLAPSITQCAMTGTWEVKRPKSNSRWMPVGDLESSRVVSANQWGTRVSTARRPQHTVLAGTQRILSAGAVRRGIKKLLDKKIQKFGDGPATVPRKIFLQRVERLILPPINTTN